MKTTVTKTLMAIALTAMATFFTGCGPDEPDTPPAPATVAVTGVTLNKGSMTLTEGGSETLTATVAPSNATNTGVSWSSSNTSVATVNGGQVTAVKAGTATITVTTADGNKTATCSVNVEAKKVAVTGIKIDPATLELIEGETGTIKATVEPADATNKTVNWSSSSAEVATVADGVVTAVAPGTATIIATTADGGKIASCAVTVNPKPIPVDGVSVEVKTVEVAEGGSAAIVVTVTPEDATVKDVTFSSSDETVATVDAEGNVTGVAPGTATITVTTADGGKTATCDVTVTPKFVPVEEVSFTETGVSVVEGQKTTVSVTFNPANPTNKTVTYTSSDESVAKVDAKGNVTGVKPGTATITVTTEDGGKTATCTVTVTKKPTPVSAVTINRTAITLIVDGAADLVATVSPEDATNKKVTWSSSDEAVVKVDQNGEVTGVKPGTAKITVTTADGGKTATCDVTVTDKPVSATGVTLNKSSLTLNIGKTEQLTATVAPSNVTNHEVTWTSDNTAVATVDKTGKITGIKAGTANITAKTHNGKTATCKVTVSAKMVTKITLSKTSLTLYTGDSAVKLTATVTPSDATNKAVSWSSNKTNVVTVDQNGNVTPKGAGTATITCAAKDGSNVKATCSVTVYKRYSVYYSTKHPATTSSTPLPNAITVYYNPFGSVEQYFMVYDNKDKKELEGKDFNFSFDTSVFTDYGFNENTRAMGVIAKSAMTKNVSFTVNGTTIGTVTYNIKKPTLGWIHAATFSALPSATSYYSSDNPGITLAKGATQYLQLHNLSTGERYKSRWSYYVETISNKVSASNLDNVVTVYTDSSSSTEGYIQIKGKNKGTAMFKFRYTYGAQAFESTVVVTVQ